MTAQSLFSVKLSTVRRGSDILFISMKGVFVMELEGTMVMLRPLRDSDAESLVTLVQNNKSFWAETEPRREESFYTIETQRSHIQICSTKIRKGTSYTFGIFSIESGELIGDISLYDVRKHPFHSALVGYSIDQYQLGKGFGTESLKLMLGFAFNQLKLHRVTAGVMPRNFPSIRVLEKAGFQKEGLSRENVCINGRWEDHLQFSILRREWEGKVNRIGSEHT